MRYRPAGVADDDPETYGHEPTRGEHENKRATLTDEMLERGRLLGKWSLLSGTNQSRATPRDFLMVAIDVTRRFEGRTCLKGSGPRKDW